VVQDIDESLTDITKDGRNFLDPIVNMVILESTIQNPLSNKSTLEDRSWRRVEQNLVEDL
jgi:hypothetical protein